MDVLFRSAAEVFGAGVLGVVMTGMGADGREGAAWIKAKGGRVITEAEETLRGVRHAPLGGRGRAQRRGVALERVAEAIMERL